MNLSFDSADDGVGKQALLACLKEVVDYVHGILPKDIGTVANGGYE